MAIEAGLVGHWPLESDERNRTALPLSTVRRAVMFSDCDGRVAARFNGADSAIEVADHQSLQLGAGDFSVAMWLHTADGVSGGDVIGDLINKFDHDARRGFNLGVQTTTGVTQTTQSNYRHLQFGIDNAQLDPQWTSCGRPGHAVKISAMVSIQGALYVGTCENAPDHVGHLWRYRGNQQWDDLGGAPQGCNCVGSMTEHKGDLYCSTGRYDPNGSAMGSAKNPTPGGKVYRIEKGEWIDCGHPGAEGARPDDATPEANTYFSDKADEALCLTTYRGDLFSVSNHRKGMHRYLGNHQWENVGPDLRIMSVTIHQGRLYALINGGPIYRYESDNNWTYCGLPEGSEQTYCAITYRGDLYVGTWPECEIWRYDDGEAWTNIGRIGYEREVMGVALYNGKVYFGTLPMANVWRMDSDQFKFMGNLDNDPNYYLRRVWSMAVHDGRLYAGTVPSGLVLSRQAGCMATHDWSLKPGWRHIAALRNNNQLNIFIDGKLIGTSIHFNTGDYDLSNNQPLRIGHGVGHVLNGSLRDVRIYDRALSIDEVGQLVRT